MLLSTGHEASSLVACFFVIHYINMNKVEFVFKKNNCVISDNNFVMSIVLSEIIITFASITNLYLLGIRFIIKF